MASSTVPVMVSTLVGLFQTAPALASVQVLYGESGQAQRENLSVTGNVTFPDESWAELGARSRRETYALDGFIQTRTPGDTPQAALEGAWALAAGVEGVLRQLMVPGDPTLTAAIAGAFPAQTVQIENIEFKPKPGTAGRVFPSAEGSAYQIDFDIHIKARI